MKTFTDYQTDIPRIANIADSDTKTWCMEVINDQIRYLVKTFYFNERTYAIPGGTQASTQWYRLPPNMGEVVDVTVNINGVLWIPSFAGNRRYWDALNVISFVQDYPLFFYVWNNQLGLFPMPATTGYPVSINYKERIVDLSQTDYTTGTVAATQYKTGSFTATANSSTLTATTNSYTPFLQVNDPVTLISTATLPTGFTAGTTYYVKTISGTSGAPLTSGNTTSYSLVLAATLAGTAITPTSAGTGQMTYQVTANVITGSGTTWSQSMTGQWIKLTPSTTDAANGDGRWYQIQSVDSASQITLFNEYTGTGTTASITGAAYRVGQVSLLNENYQDMPLWYMAMIYYTTRFPDKGRYEMYKQMYEQKYEELNKEFGSKTTSPVLLDSDTAIVNPNLFVMNQAGH